MLYHTICIFLSLETGAIAATIYGIKGTDDAKISFYMLSAVY
jgi:hypothetical protein